MEVKARPFISEKINETTESLKDKLKTWGNTGTSKGTRPWSSNEKPAWGHVSQSEEAKLDPP